MTSTPTPRILCLADVFPWPARDGYRIRLAHIVRALAGAGEVDFFAAERGEVDLSGVPDDLRLARVAASTAPPSQVTPSLMARTLTSPLPRRVLWRDWDRAREDLDRFAQPPYDLVWYSHSDSYAGLGRVRATAAVFDTVDLEDVRLRSLRRAHVRGLGHALARPSRAPDLTGELRYRVTGALATHDARRWHRLQHRLCAEVDATVVCSELDRDRLGAANARVIPNGYVEPEVTTGGASRRPVMAMVGLFHYGPNSDGARFFVHEVLPRVRRRVPGATLKLIGRHDGHLGDLVGQEGIVVTGQVPDVATELAEARVAIVPIRAGSGTRLKVIEAFASRIPVVSTTLGCEGIDVVAGRHLLVADAPEAFADACVTLLSDDRRHAQIADEAWSLFQSRYRWQDIGLQVQQLVSSLTAGVTAHA
jgi:glycosyltransferase involved in cell wall biosynthesis